MSYGKLSLKIILIALLWIPITVFAEEQEIDYLFFDTFLASHPLDNSIDAITFDYENFYLSMDILSEILDLELVYDKDKQLLSGWFIRKKNLANINFLTGKGIVKNIKIEISPSDFYIDDDVLFLSTKALREWFGINSEFKTSRLLVNFTTEEVHPKIARIEREQKHRVATQIKNNQVNFPLKAEEYQLFSYPKIELQASPRYQSSRLGSSTDLNINLNGVTDVLYQGGKFQYSQNKNTRSARATFYRNIKLGEKDLYYEWGDVRGLDSPFLASNNLGAGLVLAASEQSTQDRFSRRFEGPAPEGWEAELYRGESVIEYQVVGADGHFLFDNIPVSIGRNNFKVVLYGPSGEQREEEFIFNNAALAATEGQWLPEISIHRGGRSLFFSDENKVSTPTITAKLHRGLDANNDITLGWLKQELEDSELDLTTLAFSGFNDFSRYRTELAYDRNTSSKAYNLELGILLHDYDMNFSFTDTTSLLENSKKTGIINLIANNSTFEHSMNYQIIKETGRWNSALSGTFGKSYELFSFGSNLSYQQRADNGESINGNVQLAYRMGLSSLQMQNSFSVTSAIKFKNSNINWRRRFGGYNIQLSSRFNFENKIHNYGFSMSKLFGHFRLGSSFNIDSNNSLSFGLTFTTGAEFNPIPKTLTGQGVQQFSTIEASAFIDENYNGILDNQEQLLSNVGFKGNTAWRNIRSQENGRALLNRSKGNAEQMIELDFVTLDDPFLHAPNTGFRVKSHPGGLSRIYFPLQQTVELEGEIQQLVKNELKGKGGVPLLLIDQNGVVIKKLHSEYDGFFIFEKLLPGIYQFKIEEKYLHKHNLQQLLLPDVTISANINNGVYVLEPLQLLEKTD